MTYALLGSGYSVIPLYPYTLYPHFPFPSYLCPMSYPKVYLYRRIVQAKLYIDSHFAEPLDLDNIADEAFFSKFHFIRLFSKSYGRTPHQYLTFVRIRQAKVLLKKGASVSDTCFS